MAVVTILDMWSKIEIRFDFQTSLITFLEPDFYNKKSKNSSAIIKFYNTHMLFAILLTLYDVKYFQEYWKIIHSKV